MTDMLLRRRPSDSPWPIEDLVRAQRMACEGASFDDIAETLGRPLSDVRRKLDPGPATPRDEYANVGHPHLKSRRHGALP
jgi:hypothetical protein